MEVLTEGQRLAILLPLLDREAVAPAVNHASTCRNQQRKSVSHKIIESSTRDHRLQIIESRLSDADHLMHLGNL